MRASTPRETAGAPGFLAYELDRLFRSERRLEPVAAGRSRRSEPHPDEGLGRQEMPSEDRAHLNRVCRGRDRACGRRKRSAA